MLIREGFRIDCGLLGADRVEGRSGHEHAFIEGQHQRIDDRETLLIDVIGRVHAVDCLDPRVVWNVFAGDASDEELQILARTSMGG